MGLFGTLLGTVADVVTLPFDVVQDVFSLGDTGKLQDKCDKLLDDAEQIAEDIEDLTE